MDRLGLHFKQHQNKEGRGMKHRQTYGHRNLKTQWTEWI